MTALLAAENLHKNYGQFTALNGVDLGLPEGRLTSIIGPNGAGKTTLINVITGLVPADEGRVYLKGQDITRLPAHERVRPEGRPEAIRDHQTVREIYLGEEAIV